MTDIIKIALIAAVPPTVAALGSFFISLRTSRKMAEVAVSVDGVKDELVRTTRLASFAAGVKHEQDNPEAKPK
jgi:hypothetical protein